MKNFTLLGLLLFFLGLVNPSFSQTTHNHQRCHTMEAYEELFRTVPGFKEQFEANQARIAQLAAQNSSMRTTAINDTVPVVIHVILSAANHALATDAIMQSQIDVLNEDFNGRNADSTRIPAAFKPLFGKMGITFMLAKTSPTNTLTNGIERRTSTVTYTAGTADQAKSTASGGLDAWDPTKYLNLWVVDFGTTGLLGISVFPGDPRPLNLHGFVCDYRAFGRGGAFLYPEFNRGRTTTHELGHFWNLRHIWGDDGTACTGSDFPATTLPAGTDDTPNQAGATLGNPDVPGTGTVRIDACSPAAPGIMYQNYMDYSDDVALVMFTAGQATRMEGALTVSLDRRPVLSSLTYQPPVVVPNDAGITAIVSPAAGGQNCTAIVTPVVTLYNFGNNNLTSVNITVTVNGVAGSPYAWTGNLAPNTSVNVTLPNITLSNGANTVAVATSLPNGVVDGNAANNSTSIITNLPVAVNSPVTAGFETNVLPAGWSVFNPNANVTWTRRAPGRNSGFAAFFDNFNNNVPNQIDDIRTSIINVSGAASISFDFDLAHKNYNNTTLADTLTILASQDCGATFTSVYKKWGTTLATAGTSTANYTTPATTDWRKETIALPASFASTGKLQFAIRNTNRFGNNIFVDNVNIASVFNRDIQLLSIDQPALLTCGTSVTPSVTIRNVGVENVTGVKISYSLNGGAPATTTVNNLNLAQNAQTTVTLNPANTAPGSYTLTVYSWDPVTSSGTGDQNTSNDTLRRNFSVAKTVQAPIVETFEGTAFPPDGWSVVNPDGATTWAKANVGNASSGSAFIRNRTYTNKGQRDDLATPQITYSGVDSVILSFDLSAATYLYPGATDTQMDTLEVLVTTNCGNSFTSVYKKWGAELQTVNDPNSPQDVEFVASANGNWRNERIDLTRFNTQSPILVLFRSTNNNGNTIYLDNVNLRTRVLPAALKQQGYLILPTSFQNSFNIWHVQQPTSLRYVNVFNAAGQRVFSQQFGKNGAANVITVDMTGKAAGMYVVQLGYDDENRNITQRVFKY